MRNLSKKIIYITLVTVALFALYQGLNIYFSGHLEISINIAGYANAADFKTTGIPVSQTPYQLPTFHNRLDVYQFIVGIFLSVLGLAAIALAFLRWKTKDLLLIAFGLFSFLYGARTNAFEFLFDASRQFWAYEKWFITYLVPIPGFFFVEQILGRGWKSSIRRMWQIAVAFAIISITVCIYLKKPSAAFAANNILAIMGLTVIMVNLFRPGIHLNREIRVLRVGFVIFAVFAFHGNLAHLILTGPFAQDFEPAGLLILFCCFGYLVAFRFFQNQKDLITIEHELETARQIQAFILPQKIANIEGLDIAARYVPMATMAGDFYDFLVIDEKHIGILVADVSGHGVPASLIGSMVKVAYVSQMSHAPDPTRVLSGINKILCGKLESDFVSAGYLYLDIEQQSGWYAGAGHPPLMRWRASEQKIKAFYKKGIILGQFEDATFDTIRMNLSRGDRYILYTDGIIEASNSAGEIFGWDRLKAFVEFNSSLSVTQFADNLIETLYSWSGKSAQATLDDDLTLVVIDFNKEGKRNCG